MLSQQFTLRAHSSSITYILPLCNSNLVSADSNGHLITWNLKTRRPIKRWEGHTDSILTLIELDNGDIVSHSRDSTIKIWRDYQEVFSMPVNSLNFSNVVIMNSKYLITPATIDANNFDVYKLDCTDQYQITRVITNFNGYSLVHPNSDTSGRNFGIIMKMLVVKDILYLGYESGDILAFKIEFDITPTIITKTSTGTGKLSQLLKETKTIINKDPKVTLINHITIHTPNPIISLTYNKQVIAGSTTNKLSLDNTTLKLNHSGIQTILPINNLLIIGYWKGIIEMYKDNQCVSSKERTLPKINTLTSNKGNDTQEEQSCLVKLTFMVNTQKQSTTTTAYSSRFKQRFSDKELVFVGYEDGTIYVYSID